jgi:hypothetical protein
LAQALLIGREFIGGEPCCLILGDHIFFGHGLPDLLRRAVARRHGATIFAYRVRDPERYDVVEFDSDGWAISLEEKPLRARSNYAITGLSVVLMPATARLGYYAESCACRSHLSLAFRRVPDCRHSAAALLPAWHDVLGENQRARAPV